MQVNTYLKVIVVLYLRVGFTMVVSVNCTQFY